MQLIGPKAWEDVFQTILSWFKAQRFISYEDKRFSAPSRDWAMYCVAARGHSPKHNSPALPLGVLWTMLWQYPEASVLCDLGTHNLSLLQFLSEVSFVTLVLC